MSVYVNKLDNAVMVLGPPERVWADQSEERKDVVRDALASEQEETQVDSVPRPYKRSDIPTAVVLSCVHTLGFAAFEVLSETFPEKVVHAAFLRELGKGLLECGTSECRPWMTIEGKQWLVEHSDAARRGRKLNGQSELREKPCTLTISTRPHE